jgi:hypothetical protein
MLRHRPEALYCVLGACGECSPALLTRCWQRRAELPMQLRVVRFHVRDERLGHGYIVELVSPRGPWELRAWGGSGEGLVWEGSVEPIATP